MTKTLRQTLDMIEKLNVVKSVTMVGITDPIFILYLPCLSFSCEWDALAREKFQTNNSFNQSKFMVF